MIIGLVLAGVGILLWIISSIVIATASTTAWFYDPTGYTGAALTGVYLGWAGHVFFWIGLALTVYALVRRYIL